ncbi:unnamed protein product [Prunus armeniaca]|uniref:Uncharacterized protein n=1 Tax=Prunus armeniaca TaxID=36596 RepID=A0A6J5UK97_PRUAR|nr:unnamed protein product [Prunus armeniaca]
MPSHFASLKEQNTDGVGNVAASCAADRYQCTCFFDRFHTVQIGTHFPIRVSSLFLGGPLLPCESVLFSRIGLSYWRACDWVARGTGEDSWAAAASHCCFRV